MYAAEAASIDGLGRRWRRLADVQAHVDRLIESDWFLERWPDLVRCVVERRGRGSTWSAGCQLGPAGPGRGATEGVILLADDGLRQPVVLHELAHLVVPEEVGHQPPFAEALLTLVRHDMGFFAWAECWHALRRSPLFALVRPEVGPALERSLVT